MPGRPYAPSSGVGRRVAERHGHQPAPGLDRQANLQRLVGVHAVVVDPLPLEVVIGTGISDARDRAP